MPSRPEFFNGIGDSRKGEKMYRITQEVGSRKHTGQMQLWTDTNLDALKSKIRCETNSRRTEYGNMFGGKGRNSGLTSGYSTMTMPLCMMRRDFARSWLRNPLKKWAIHLIHLN
jgi:hypothetical protein